MRRLAVVTAYAAIAPLTVLGVVLTAADWWEGLTTVVGYLLALGVLREWSLDGYPRRAIFALMCTAASWIMSALSATAPISFVPLSLIGALLLARVPSRLLWIGVFTLGVAAIGTGAFVFHTVTWDLVKGFLLTPIIGTLFIAGVILVSEQAWQVVRRLERAADTEAELAVARERVRFASDLHDIQGHSLHVIKLKAALAGRTVRADPDRAEAELGDIRRLAAEAITEARGLAYGRVEMSLAAELENTKRLGEAAGIAVEARLDDPTRAPTSPLLAQVLREATTNLLRHAHPTVVTITASPEEVEVTNDGVIDATGAPLRGLARLRERVESAGGTMRIERSPDRFVVAARIGAGPTGRDGEDRP